MKSLLSFCRTATRANLSKSQKSQKSINIPVFFTKNNAEILDIIINTSQTSAFWLLSARLLKMRLSRPSPCGIFNIHPSLLPKYRGTTPIESALLNNDSETGVSVMRLAHDMDAGNILAQTTVQITPETTKQVFTKSSPTLGAKSPD